MSEPQSPDAGALGERLAPREKLKRRADFVRCYKLGRRQHGPLATLHYSPNGLGHPRLGITASRKVGSAVVRHRLKRRIREIYRRWDDKQLLPPADLVFHLKPAASQSDFSSLRTEVERLMRRLSRAAPPRSRPGRSSAC